MPETFKIQVEFVQQPGCLPQGYDLDSILTPEQFCIWWQVGKDWFSTNLPSMKGVISHSRKTVRIHPRSFLEANKPKV